MLFLYIQTSIYILKFMWTIMDGLMAFMWRWNFWVRSAARRRGFLFPNPTRVQNQLIEDFIGF